MPITIPSAQASFRTARPRGFGHLVVTEGKVWVRGSDVFWALLFPTLLILGQAAIAPELGEIASGDTWAGTPFYGVDVIDVILPAMLAMPIAITALTIMPATFGGFRKKAYSGAFRHADAPAVNVRRALHHQRHDVLGRRADSSHRHVGPVPGRHTEQHLPWWRSGSCSAWPR
jgi:hypothetical protein